MGSMGSPFDAPLPRFQQAAAHLSSSLGSSSSKKPPLSEHRPLHAPTVQECPIFSTLTLPSS